MQLGNINIFGPEKNKDNISDINKDTFVPIGDEFINSIINSFINNQNDSLIINLLNHQESVTWKVNRHTRELELVWTMRLKVQYHHRP